MAAGLGCDTCSSRVTMLESGEFAGVQVSTGTGVVCARTKVGGGRSARSGCDSTAGGDDSESTTVMLADDGGGPAFEGSGCDAGGCGEE